MPSSAPIDAAWAELPVAERLPDLARALSGRGSAILVAPPGAGKTTAVAPFLLGEDWLRGRRILLTLPRRLAARAAAERIAALLGEPVGRRVGYRTRLEQKIGSGCRIECVTEGIFVNRILHDPELADVALVLFDEVHERSLDADLALALALDVRAALRPDLKLVAMSATLDGARLAALMDDAAIIESRGRQHPVDIVHVGRGGGRIEDAMADWIGRGLERHEGSLLAFLPGVAEIERVAKRLALPAGVQLHKLHGSADPAEQRAAVVAGRHGRACILATAIAETSLTLDGVRIVVDSGLARRARFDRASGLSRLATEKASQAAVAQRAGRAGRQGPGVAIRLWDEGETRARPPFDPPEIAEADLSSMLLGLATFGVTDPATLRWLDPPTPAALADARTRLRALGAIDGAGHLVPHGRLMARLPLAPPLAHMLLEAARRGAAANAARLALLVEERGLGGRSSDIEDRMEMFNRDRSGRAEAARRLADRWAATADGLVAGTATGPTDAASLLALAYPDRVARRRIATGAERPSWQMAGGPAVWLDGGDPLARSEWLVVADATGAGPDARLALGAAFDCSSIGQWVAERAETVDRIEYDAGAARMVAERVQMLGALQLGRAALAAPGREALAQAWLDRLRACGLDLLQWPEAERQLRQRIGFARAHGLGGLPSVDAAALLDRAHEWLLPLLEGVERLDRVSLEGVIASMLDHPARSALDRFAPPRFITPAGTSHSICYRDGVLPEVEVRIQAMFGLAAHPTIACGRVPLMLALTSPAGRIVQKTTDLGAFWSGSWADVRREMRGRYPRHPWPEDPATAPPTTRSKRAAAIGG